MSKDHRPTSELYQLLEEVVRQLNKDFGRVREQPRQGAGEPPKGPLDLYLEREPQMLAELQQRFPHLSLDELREKINAEF